MAEKYQTINLKLSDGRTITASVPEFCTEEQCKDLELIAFKVHPPKELPESCSFVEVNDVMLLNMLV